MIIINLTLIVNELLKKLSIVGIQYFSFFKFKYNWYTILSNFQVYNILIWHFYTLQCDHIPNSSNYLSPCKCITILLTIFPFIVFIHPPSLDPTTTIPFGLCFYESGFFLFCFVYLFCFLGSTYQWNHMVFVSLSELFHLA